MNEDVGDVFDVVIIELVENLEKAVKITLMIDKISHWQRT
jgi:hypothetical protein